MSYERKRKVFKLTFEDPELEGLEVRMKSIPVKQMLKLLVLADLDTGSLTAKDIQVVDDLMMTFSMALISWNLTETDPETQLKVPVPATYDGVCSQDLDFVLSLIGAWAEGLAGVSVPLPKSSHDGATSLEASMQTVPLSASRAS